MHSINGNVMISLKSLLEDIILPYFAPKSGQAESAFLFFMLA